MQASDLGQRLQASGYWKEFFDHTNHVGYALLAATVIGLLLPNLAANTASS